MWCPLYVFQNKSDAPSHLENLLNSSPPGKFFSLFLSPVDSFQKHHFWKILSGMPSEYQLVWIQILSGLIWVQTVCKDYQQTPLGSKELNLQRQIDGTALCPWARHINLCLLLVQPRINRPNKAENCWLGHKESNQTNKQRQMGKKSI